MFVFFIIIIFQKYVVLVDELTSRQVDKLLV